MCWTASGVRYLWQAPAHTIIVMMETTHCWRTCSFYRGPTHTSQTHTACVYHSLNTNSQVSVFSARLQHHRCQRWHYYSSGSSKLGRRRARGNPTWKKPHFLKTKAKQRKKRKKKRWMWLIKLNIAWLEGSFGGRSAGRQDVCVCVSGWVVGV